MFGGASSIQLVRVFGIRIGVSPSWFVVLFLMIYVLTGYFDDVLGGSDQQAFLTAVGGAALFFASLILHELGHALAARRSGIGIAGIDLWFFGGVAKMERDTRSPREELFVAGSGPAVTLLIIGVCAAITSAATGGGSFWDAATLRETSRDPLLALAGWLAVVNAFLFAFNMIPAFPLDGGRLARAAAWKVTNDRTKGTRFSARLGQGFSYLMIGFGVFLLAIGNVVDGIWSIVLGWFLGQAATSAIVTSGVQERLEGVTVREIMDAQPVTLPGVTPASVAADDWYLRYGWPWFAVTADDGRFLGVLERATVDDAVTHGRPALPVLELLEPAQAGRFAVAAREPLEALLGSEPLGRLGALMVLEDDGRLAGVVTVEQVRRALAAAAPGRLT